MKHTCQGLYHPAGVFVTIDFIFDLDYNITARGEMY